MTRDVDSVLATLLDPAAPRDERVAALRDLVTGATPARAAEVLRAAAAAPHNADVLPVVVRSYGYLNLEVSGDLRAYLDDKRPEIVENATKALVALDPNAAMQVIGPLLRRVPSRLAATIVRVLAERAPNEARRAMEGLAGSARSRHRMVALVFLKRAPIESSLAFLLDMFRRDPSPKVRRVILKVIAKSVTPAQAPELLAFHGDLLQKAAEIQKVIDHRGIGSIDASAELDAAALPASRELNLEVMRSAVIAADAPYDAAAVGGKIAVPAAAAPPPPRPSGPFATPVRPAAPAASSTGVFVAGARLWERHRALAPALGVILVLALIALRVLTTAGGPTVAERQAARDAKLGTVGARVEVVGEVTEVRANERRLRVRGDSRVEYEIRFAAPQPSTYRAGQRVRVEGIVRDIRGDASIVLLGLSVKII